MTYGKSYQQFQGKELNFDFMIMKSGENNFNAMSRDADGFGVNSSDAFARGFFNDQFIVFKKCYDSTLQMSKNGDFVEDSRRKSPEVHYFGIYNTEQEEFEGTWKVKFEVKVFGKKIFKITHGRGAWRMWYEKPLPDDDLGC